VAEDNASKILEGTREAGDPFSSLRWQGLRFSELGAGDSRDFSDDAHPAVRPDEAEGLVRRIVPHQVAAQWSSMADEVGTGTCARALDAHDEMGRC